MPDRMTKKRAKALWSAISRGIDEMEAELDDGNYTKAEYDDAQAAAGVFYRRYIQEKK